MSEHESSSELQAAREEAILRFKVAAQKLRAFPISDALTREGQEATDNVKGTKEELRKLGMSEDEILKIHRGV